MFGELLDRILFLSEGVRQAYRVYVEGGKLDNETFDKIKGVDPTPGKKYVDWMCKQVVKDGSLDIDQLGIMVKEFDEAVEKGKIKKKDVQAYSFEELDKELDRIKGVQTKGEMRKAQKEDVEVILDNDRFLIVSPKTKEAAILYGKHTKWCTSALVDNEFDIYAKAGTKLYYIIDRESNKKWAVGVDFDGAIKFWDDKDKKVHSFLKKVGLDKSWFVPYVVEELINLRLRDEGMVKNNDGLYDVSGDVKLGGLRLKEIPFQFRRVDGYFDCSGNRLVSLKGSPEWVGKSFYCGGNYLVSLEGAPGRVEEGFSCISNKLVSLRGSPEYVGGSFGCARNRLATLEGAPEHVGWNFDCSRNRLTSLKGVSGDIGGEILCDNNSVPKAELLKTIGR